MAQEHFDRLTALDASFLHQEGPTSHMHVGARHDLRGTAAAVRGRPRPRARPPAPRAALPPAAGDAAAADRAAAVGRRPDVQPRVPRPPDRAAAPRPREPAPAPGRAALQPAARPLQAAVGDVDRRGPRRWAAFRRARRPALRADLEDPPLAHRRRRGRRPRPGPLRPRPGPGRAAPPRRGLGGRIPSRPPAELVAHGALGAVRTGLQAAARGGRGPHPAGRRAARGAHRGRGRRRGRLGRPEPGARDAAERRDRPAPPLRRASAATCATTSSSRTPSAAPSTTSC